MDVRVEMMKMNENSGDTKPRTSKLAIASFVMGILAIGCMILYLYDEVFFRGLNYLLFPGSTLALVSSEENVLEKICLVLPVLSVMVGIAAIGRIACSSKKRKGYILAIASIVLILTASAICVSIILGRIGTIS
jgi:hypothetical protein